MPTIGPMEIVVICAVLVLLFGGKKFAELGKGLGEGIWSFRKGIKDMKKAERELED